MGEPLKTFFSPELVRRMAADIERVAPAFPARAFARRASRGLDGLELLERARQIADALGEHLPAAYPDAIEVLLRSLGPEHATDELIGAGMAPFYYLPHTLLVAERGLEHFDLSLDAQYALTKRFSAEGSIRTFIAADPERTFARLHVWATDDDAHVRRLPSEGTRLRLPWARRVPWLDANPRRVLELLERLKDDPAPLVRRSVANNLNDLSKVHPELAVETCRAWLGARSAGTEALVRHALRSLVKKGHRGALQVLGVGAHPFVAVQGGRLSTRSVRLGGELGFSFELVGTKARPQRLAVDYAVHFVKANGTTRAKVFKLKQVTLHGATPMRFEGKVSFVPMTTRRHYPGRHRIEILVNGFAFPLGEFELRR
ncbi:MAG: DNA alkylation repair protein [Deltaproteobacteria bacterium]|nr:DNA alkylation repair protein [Deltaproteobacteria bacterium]